MADGAESVDQEAIESYNEWAQQEHVVASAKALRLLSALQDTANLSKDTDGPCHVCVFGLMGHGKSRILNLMLTAVANPPTKSEIQNYRAAPREDDGEVLWRDEDAGKVRVSNQVPSGEGSTTRAYSRYLLPVHTTVGLARFPFYLVDTIGVKFGDETNPSEREMLSEFQLVRAQLKGLDFRERIGAFREAYSYQDAVTKEVVAVAKGEDVIDIRLSAKDTRVCGVTLRGGHVLHSVPLASLWDPDGHSWEYSEGKGFVDKRSVFRRLDHYLKGRKWRQPTCQAALLVVNPHQEVPERVYDAWATVFEEAGFGEIPVVATHSDIEGLFGGGNTDQFKKAAWRNLSSINVGMNGEDSDSIFLVENYTEDSLLQRRRWLSEQNALRALVRAARSAQTHERGVDGVNQKAQNLFVGAAAAFAVYKGVSLLQRAFARKLK